MAIAQSHKLSFKENPTPQKVWDLDLVRITGIEPAWNCFH